MKYFYKNTQVPSMQIVTDMVTNGIKNDIIKFLALHLLAEVLETMEEAEREEDSLMDISSVKALEEVLLYSVESLDDKEIKSYIKLHPESELVKHVLTLQSLPGATPMQKWHHNHRYITATMKAVLNNNVKDVISNTINDIAHIDSKDSLLDT